MPSVQNMNIPFAFEVVTNTADHKLELLRGPTTFYVDHDDGVPTLHTATVQLKPLNSIS